MKRIIRLTESDLHRIIKESVRRIIREDVLGNNWNAEDAFEDNSNDDFSNNNITSVSNNYEAFDDQTRDNDWSVSGEENIDPTQYNPNDARFKR
jgi:hypothetical protein